MCGVRVMYSVVFCGVCVLCNVCVCVVCSVRGCVMCVRV